MYLFFLSRYPGIGGIESVTTLIINALNGGGEIISALSQTGIEVPSNIKVYTLPNEDIYSKNNYDYVERNLKGKKYEAVIFQDSYAYNEKFPVWLSRYFGIPLYVFEHNSPLFIYNKRSLDPITTMKGFLRRLLHPYLLYREVNRKRYLLENSEKYILLSKQYIPEFCRLIGADVNDKRITYINNPIRYNPLQKDRIIVKENIIFTACQHNKTKQINLMLEIWNMINHDGWQFIIAGDGPEHTNLKKYAASLNISGVKFVGYVNPTEYYKKAKIFWMTSKFEGWPMTLLESMQNGCVPVVFDTFSSLHDLVVDKENGMIIRPFDKEAFSLATSLLMKNDENFVEMANNAIVSIARYDLERIIQQWNNLLNIKS